MKTLIFNLQSLRNMITLNATDMCETRDPCQHGGICISTDTGPFCECRNGDYEGIYCEKGKVSLLVKNKHINTKKTRFFFFFLNEGKKKKKNC